MSRETYLGAALLIGFGSLFLARAVLADPVAVSWQNTAPADFPPSDHVELCVDVCSQVAVTCPPGASCSSVHDLPPGEYASARLRLAALREGITWSETASPSPQPVTVPDIPDSPEDACTGACRADLNGDGWVSMRDFAVFLRHLGSQVGAEGE